MSTTSIPMKDMHREYHPNMFGGIPRVSGYPDYSSNLDDKAQAGDAVQRERLNPLGGDAACDSPTPSVTSGPGQK
jgi:hypothetical protein